ncbi:MAG: alpha/beta hydrolase [Desulfobacula sp.]
MKNKRIFGYRCWAFLSVAAILLLCLGAAPAHASWPLTAVSDDGTPISYEVQGKGDPALVFVHGWSCDARYWRAQVPYFEKKYKVVTVDLAGHGHSGSGRDRYTMKAFGEDVAAVVKAMEARKVILVGHSMGGIVIAEAARLMPDRVLGLIGVDTLQNIEYPMTGEELEKMTAPLKQDFHAGCRAFVRSMMLPSKDPRLSEWIVADMSAARPDTALSAMNEMMALYISGDAARLFDAVRLPVICVNADLWPGNPDANRRHMLSYETITIKGADHFLMMNRSDEFNPALEKAVKKISAKNGK